ncbi:TIGR00341 family protein [Mucilaginibacter sp. CAU 1740]|uniref:TIGR00341 family protein n=1 Tax=Mucilaginibacter sp. CAU 1740 TaxID=3140365 RepID=UPI00325A67B9
MPEFIDNIREFLSSRFNLQEGKAEEAEITASVRGNVDFKGVNLWTLIFAIFIASIGLNVNSTAVIIGAMLISPIMGPVMGVGLGVGINDLELVKRGLKNLLVATVIAVLTSAIYFLVTPLHEAQSELLARTSPSIWDVFIAFFGGAAGMVAASRKEKSNVIPGVAIATALMPPLCTAGFGIAMGNWYFVLGALYLYFINSVFIAISTFLVSRYLRLKKRHLEDAGQEKKVNRYIIIIVVITILPSIVMAYRIVNKSIFETNARKFVDEQFSFNNTQVVSKTFRYTNKEQAIELLLIGKELDKSQIDSLSRKLDAYRLKGVQLLIKQGLNASQHIDLSQIKASILEDVYAHQPKPDTIPSLVTSQTAATIPDSIVFSELKVLYPEIRSFGLSKMKIYHAGKQKNDTVKIGLAIFKTPLKKIEEAKLSGWLCLRYKDPSIRVVQEREK